MAKRKITELAELPASPTEVNIWFGVDDSGAGISYKVTLATLRTLILGTAEDYIHTQAVPATQWVIAHNRGENAESVSATVDGEPIVADWINLDTNNVRVDHATAQTGQAIVEFPKN